ncbi:hypothetical protein C8R42DRAFT_147694 [Lentinula raphanica]|nr:hypothetical protein C8R42DRAFT_147694 [Lentinula raphanica]
MRSQVIYAFYIAVTLPMGLASGAAIPLPADTQPGPPANSAEELPFGTRTHAIRIGLHNPVDENWVHLDADKADRDKAMFALCITTAVCLRVDNSGSGERIIEIEPKFISDSADSADSAPSQLGPQPRQMARFLHPEYYEKLDMGVLRSRFNLEAPRRELLVKYLKDIQELKKWLGEGPKTLADGKPFVLAALSILNSKKALGRLKPESSPTFQALYSETAVLLDSLKEDATEKGFRLLADDRANRKMRKYKATLAAAQTMKTTKRPSEQDLAGSSNRRSKVHNGESSASRNPSGDATKMKRTVALRLGLFDTINGQWVVPTAGEEKPHDAQYALCISSAICPYYDSNIEGRVSYTTPELFPDQRRVQSRYYKSLDVGLLLSRFANLESRQRLVKDLKQWCGSEKFFDGPSLILAILDWLESSKALQCVEGKTFAEVREETATLLAVGLT